MKSDQKMLENEIQTDFEDEFNVSKYPNESFMQWLENNDWINFGVKFIVSKSASVVDPVEVNKAVAVDCTWTTCPGTTIDPAAPLILWPLATLIVVPDSAWRLFTFKVLTLQPQKLLM